ncbi:MAG: hypothetical protein LBT60_03265 [Oscillospiraceae bacterium]|jgi:hypothetical protein|nr:hypothetical protein [Oscillospiraceae bacterium]
MTYKSQRTVVSMAAGVLSFAAYVAYALGKNAREPESGLASWAVLMLIFIGVAVVAQIAVQIVFHLARSIGIAVREGGDDKQVERIIKAAMVEDEMEKLIGLKSAHIGYICAGTGFVAALAVLALGASGVSALHVLLGSFAAGSMIEGGVSVRLYERGVRNG